MFPDVSLLRPCVEQLYQITCSLSFSAHVFQSNVFFTSDHLNKQMKYSFPHKHQHMLMHVPLFGLHKLAWHQKKIRD